MNPKQVECGKSSFEITHSVILCDLIFKLFTLKMKLKCARKAEYFNILLVILRHLKAKRNFMLFLWRKSVYFNMYKKINVC